MAHTQKTKTLSLPNRERIIALWAESESNRTIANRLGISNRTVGNIVTSSILYRGHLLALKPGWKERQIAKPDVVEYIEFQKVSKPSTTAVELQAGFLQDGICRDKNLPSKSTIGDIV